MKPMGIASNLDDFHVKLAQQALDAHALHSNT
jgi:hypothetical protein